MNAASEVKPNDCKRSGKLELDQQRLNVKRKVRQRVQCRCCDELLRLPQAIGTKLTRGHCMRVRLVLHERNCVAKAPCASRCDTNLRFPVGALSLLRSHALTEGLRVE